MKKIRFHFNKEIASIILSLLFFLLILSNILLYKKLQNNSKGEDPLCLSVQADRSAKRILKEGLTDLFYNGITYEGVTDVCICFDGQQIPLEEALRDGSVSPETLFAQARNDARSNLCQELFQTEHSLTSFVYRYPDYDLQLIYDVLKTPDGKEHLICDMGVYAPGHAQNGFGRLYDPDTMEELDWEDWGITLEAKSISPTGMTLECSQSGGQQLGQLLVFDCTLANDAGFLPTLKGRPHYVLCLERDTMTAIELDWAELYGVLPSGAYELTLSVQDVYDEVQLNPMVDKFHDWQTYAVTFSIP